VTFLRSSIAAGLLCAIVPAYASAQALGVTRATLSNGLRVVVVRDPLAPVVTAVLNYRVGSNEERYPGEAHALEHMMFRGTPSVSQTQLAEIGQLMGGDYDADTQPEMTQFFFEVPAQYLSIAMRLEADRARHLLLAQSGWQAERPAIEQEVTQDDSIPLQKLFERTILPSIFKGTPYAKDTLGTLESFGHQIDARVLGEFYHAWYHPNNAVYVIAGDVEGPATIDMVRHYFGAIPAAPLPARGKVALRPIRPATYHIVSDQPYSVVALSFRLPGWHDKDYAASQILEAVLNNQRSSLYGLVASGKTLYTGFQEIISHPDATAGAAFSVVPVTTNASTAAAELRSVLEGYRRTGLPAELVEVEKERAIAASEFQGNSIEGLAMQWSDAVAMRGEDSPDQLLQAMERVSVADVNRVFRKYFDPNAAITAFAVPRSAGTAAVAASAPAPETNTLTPEKPQPIPDWAERAFANVGVPEQTVHPVSTTFANGMRLVVIPERVTRTVEVYGEIQSDEAMQSPADKLGVDDIVSGLFPFGTTQYSRVQFLEQLDAIAADVSAGTDFSLRVPSNHFERGVQLLADDELHPAFPEAAFDIIQRQEVGTLTGVLSSPDHLVEVATNKALYPAGDPLQLFATPQTARAVTLADVRSYYASVYRPDMTTVVVIGDVTPAQAQSAFERYFGSWAAHGAKPDVTLPRVPKNAAAAVDVPDPARVQSEVELAQVVDVPRADPDWAPLQVGNAILGGGGFGSLLMDDLRTNHGYVYSVGSHFGWHKERAVFSIDYACDPDKIVLAETSALSDLLALESGATDPGRLQRAKAMLMSDVLLHVASFGGTAQQLLDYVALDLPLDEATIDARRELATTSESIEAAFSKWVAPSDFVRVVEGPGPP
jgi:zinc protease